MSSYSTSPTKPALLAISNNEQDLSDQLPPTGTSIALPTEPTNNGAASSIGQNIFFERDIVVHDNEDDDESFNVRVNRYETKLKLRVDVEAVACYLGLCFSGILMLILETENDYVRFHAWQSTLLFSAILFLKIIIGFISSFLSLVISISLVVLVGLLSFKAYTNADDLVRFKVPVFGELASRWTDRE